MAPVVAEIALEHRNTFAVARLNNDENRETIQKYQIRGQPIYLVFQDGKDVGRFRGEMPKDVLVKRILSVIDVEEN
jgi:thioredoxin 1